MASDNFDNIDISPEVKRYVSASFDISDRVKAAIKESGYDLHTIAVRIGVTDQKLSHWLCGTHDWKLSQICRLSVACEVEIKF